MNKKTLSLKSKLIIAASGIAALAVLFCIFGLTTVGSGIKNFRVCPTFTSSLDLKDAGISDFSGLDECFRLRYIDLRGNDFTPEDYAKLHDRLPDCTVAWDVPIGGKVTDSTAEQIDLDSLTAGEAQLLSSFASLKRINVGDDSVYAPLSEYCRTAGEVPFVYSVELCGENYDSDTRELTLSGANADDIEHLAYFPQLERADVSDGCTAYDEIMAFRADYPQCDLRWSVDFAGVNVSSEDEQMNIDDHRISDFEGCRKLFSYLPVLTRASMKDCGLSNSQMEELCTTYPDIRFVWNIHVENWTVPTDAVVFSTLNHHGTACTEKDFAPIFKYCTDLEVLDLGHNSMRALTGIDNLKKLKVLIVMDNYISDMSLAAELPNLVHAELYSNPWRDASFIPRMPAIRDLNIANCYISDYSFMYDLPDTLEHLVISDNYFDIEKKEMEEIKAKCPKCEIQDFWPRKTWYNNPWYNERWAGIKTACDNWPYVTKYEYWDDITYDVPDGVEISVREPRYDPSRIKD